MTTLFSRGTNGTKRLEGAYYVNSLPVLRLVVVRLVVLVVLLLFQEGDKEASEEDGEEPVVVLSAKFQTGSSSGRVPGGTNSIRTATTGDK